MNKTVEDTTRQFVNELAMQLPVSNDTMEAVRLFRKELPKFLTSQRQTLRKEIGKMGTYNIIINKEEVFLINKEDVLAIIDKI